MIWEEDVWLQLTASSVFFLSVLHSGDSGVSLFGEVTVVALLFSAVTASPTGRHGSLQRCLMSCEAEHLANTCQTQERGRGSDFSQSSGVFPYRCADLAWFGLTWRVCPVLQGFASLHKQGFPLEGVSLTDEVLVLCRKWKHTVTYLDKLTHCFLLKERNTFMYCACWIYIKVRIQPICCRVSQSK